jgi:hypothetical protein
MLRTTLTSPQERRLANPGHSLPEGWDAIAVRHVAAVSALYANDYAGAYAHQSALVIQFFRWFQDQPAWPLPVLYLLLRDLRELAEQADAPTYSATGKMPAQEECTRTVSKAFSICVTDRMFKGAQSRRLGAYHVACLSIKCYFKVSESESRKRDVILWRCELTSLGRQAQPLQEHYPRRHIGPQDAAGRRRPAA